MKTNLRSRPLRFAALISVLLGLSTALWEPVFGLEKDRQNDSLKTELDQIRSDIADMKSGIRFEGFFDVKASQYANNPNLFSLGDFEFDLVHSSKKNFEVAGAMVFNEEVAFLAVGFIDYHFYGKTISPRGRLSAERGIHIQAGKFDVPFGIDWQYYAAVDRITILPPLTTVLANDGGLNDVGFRVIGNFSLANSTFYVIRGVGRGNAFGGRVGLTPFGHSYPCSPGEIPLLEAGISGIYDGNPDLGEEEHAYALDLTARLGIIRLTGECLHRHNSGGVSERPDGEFDGYNANILFDLEEAFRAPLMIFCRYEYLERSHGDDETRGSMKRVSGGLNLGISGIVVAKVEYLHILENWRGFDRRVLHDRHSVYGQLVVIF